MMRRLKGDLMFVLPSRASSRLALSLTLGLAGCVGEMIAGVPLEDGGDEVSVDDASATASGLAREAGVTEAGSTRPAATSPAGSTPRDASSSSSTPPAAPSAPTKDAGPGAASDAGRAPASDGGRVQAAPRGDAGMSMAGTRDFTVDPARFLGSPRCASAGALLCDDFESEAVGAGPDGTVWSAPFGTLPRIDATRAARGKQSLYFELAAGAPGQIEERKTFPAASGSLFGRMFVWLDALPTAPAYAHWTLVSALGSSNPAEVRLSGQLDPNRMNANYFAVGSDHGESGDWATAGQEPGSKVRARAWICLEWLFKSDTSETQVWIDGVEQKSLHLTATEYRSGDQEAGKRFVHPRFDKLRIGWWLYQAGALPSPAKLWIDEVIVDDARIGCAL